MSIYLDTRYERNSHLQLSNVSFLHVYLYAGELQNWTALHEE